MRAGQGPKHWKSNMGTKEKEVKEKDTHVCHFFYSLNILIVHFAPPAVWIQPSWSLVIRRVKNVHYIPGEQVPASEMESKYPWSQHL